MKDRKELQTELRESTKSYNEALGLFNTTNNDYFEGTEKANEADKEAVKVRLGLIGELRKKDKRF